MYLLSRAYPSVSSQNTTILKPLAAFKMAPRRYSEEDMVNAIFDVTDNGFSLHRSAQKHGIPRQTLQNRMAGRGAQGDQEQPHQRVSKAQEDRLTTWILRQESLGYAPSHSQVRACVIALLQQQGDTAPLGQHWVERYIKRTPELKAKMGRRQEAARFNHFTRPRSRPGCLPACAPGPGSIVTSRTRLAPPWHR